jgi:hypothetical protein
LQACQASTDEGACFVTKALFDERMALLSMSIKNANAYVSDATFLDKTNTRESREIFSTTTTTTTAN